MNINIERDAADARRRVYTARIYYIVHTIAYPSNDPRALLPRDCWQINTQSRQKVQHAYTCIPRNQLPGFTVSYVKRINWLDHPCVGAAFECDVAVTTARRGFYSYYYRLLFFHRQSNMNAYGHLLVITTYSTLYKCCALEITIFNGRIVKTVYYEKPKTHKVVGFLIWLKYEVITINDSVEIIVTTTISMNAYAAATRLIWVLSTFIRFFEFSHKFKQNQLLRYQKCS